VDIFFTHHPELSGVAFLIEKSIRANSDIHICVLQKNAELVIDLDYIHSTGKNTLHCVLYDRDELRKTISQEIKNSADSRNIPSDFAKIDNRIKDPAQPTLYVKFGRENYEFDEYSWAAAVAEGIITGISGSKIEIDEIEQYKKPQMQQIGFYERNFAQEPTRNSDLFRAQ
jgi:hypothetical protein